MLSETQTGDETQCLLEVSVIFLLLHHGKIFVTTFLITYKYSGFLHFCAAGENFKDLLSVFSIFPLVVNISEYKISLNT